MRINDVQSLATNADTAQVALQWLFSELTRKKSALISELHVWQSVYTAMQLTAATETFIPSNLVLAIERAYTAQWPCTNANSARVTMAIRGLSDVMNALLTRFGAAFQPPLGFYATLVNTILTTLHEHVDTTPLPVLVSQCVLLTHGLTALRQTQGRQANQRNVYESFLANNLIPCTNAWMDLQRVRASSSIVLSVENAAIVDETQQSIEAWLSDSLFHLDHMPSYAAYLARVQSAHAATAITNNGAAAGGGVVDNDEEEKVSTTATKKKKKRRRRSDDDGGRDTDAYPKKLFQALQTNASSTTNNNSNEILSRIMRLYLVQMRRWRQQQLHTTADQGGGGGTGGGTANGHVTITMNKSQKRRRRELKMNAIEFYFFQEIVAILRPSVRPSDLRTLAGLYGVVHEFDVYRMNRDPDLVYLRAITQQFESLVMPSTSTASLSPAHIIGALECVDQMMLLNERVVAVHLTKIWCFMFECTSMAAAANTVTNAVRNTATLLLRTYAKMRQFDIVLHAFVAAIHDAGVDARHVCALSDMAECVNETVALIPVMQAHKILRSIYDEHARFLGGHNAGDANRTSVYVRALSDVFAGIVVVEENAAQIHPLCLQVYTSVMKPLLQSLSTSSSLSSSSSGAGAAAVCISVAVFELSRSLDSVSRECGSWLFDAHDMTFSPPPPYWSHADHATLSISQLLSTLPAVDSSAQLCVTASQCIVQRSHALRLYLEGNMRTPPRFDEFHNELCGLVATLLSALSVPSAMSSVPVLMNIDESKDATYTKHMIDIITANLVYFARYCDDMMLVQVCGVLLDRAKPTSDDKIIADDHHHHSDDDHDESIRQIALAFFNRAEVYEVRSLQLGVCAGVRAIMKRHVENMGVGPVSNDGMTWSACATALHNATNIHIQYSAVDINALGALFALVAGMPSDFFRSHADNMLSSVMCVDMIVQYLVARGDANDDRRRQLYRLIAQVKRTQHVLIPSCSREMIENNANALCFGVATLRVSNDESIANRAMRTCREVAATVTSALLSAPPNMDENGPSAVITILRYAYAQDTAWYWNIGTGILLQIVRTLDVMESKCTRTHRKHRRNSGGNSEGPSTKRIMLPDALFALINSVETTVVEWCERITPNHPLIEALMMESLGLGLHTLSTPHYKHFAYPKGHLPNLDRIVQLCAQHSQRVSLSPGHYLGWRGMSILLRGICRCECVRTVLPLETLLALLFSLASRTSMAHLDTFGVLNDGWVTMVSQNPQSHQSLYAACAQELHAHNRHARVLVAIRFTNVLLKDCNRVALDSSNELQCILGVLPLLTRVDVIQGSVFMPIAISRLLVTIVSRIQAIRLDLISAQHVLVAVNRLVETLLTKSRRNDLSDADQEWTHTALECCVTVLLSTLKHRRAIVYQQPSLFFRSLKHMIASMYYGRAHMPRACVDSVARLFDEIGRETHRKPLNKYIIYIVFDMMTLSEHYTLSQPMERLLEPGVFALLSAFSVYEYKLLYTALSTGSRALFRDWHDRFKTSHVYTGKA